jgi:hypothetical protein
MTPPLAQVAHPLRFGIILLKKRAKGRMDSAVHFKPAPQHHTLGLRVATQMGSRWKRCSLQAIKDAVT